MTNQNATPQCEDILRFWRHVYGNQSGLLQIWTGVRKGSEIPDETINSQCFNYPNAARDAAMWALEKSEEEGREVYQCAHLLDRPKREKRYASEVLTLWSDLDEASLPNGDLSPTAVVESSPGRYQCFWRLSDPLPPGLAESLNRRLNRYIEADNGWHLGKLLRVPFTTNYKYSDKPTVGLRDLDSGRDLVPALLDSFLPNEAELESATGSATDPATNSEYTEEPPVALSERAMEWWTGKRAKYKKSGKLDRSASLIQIGRVLFDAGANRATVVSALRERDKTLGWHKYTDRKDRDRQYGNIVTELQKKGRNPSLESDGFYFRHSETRFGENKDSNDDVLPIKTIEELIEEAGEEVPWIIEDVLARGALTDFYGLAKRGGKTTFWTHAVVAGARGEDHAGFETKEFKCLYLTEQGHNFVQALKDSGLKDYPDHIRLVQFKDVAAKQWEKLVNQAGHEAHKRGYDVLIVDTFSVFAKLKGSEENDSGPVGDRMRALRLVAQKYDIGVVLIRHAGKDGKARGSSAFEGEADIVVGISRPDGRHAPTVRKLDIIGRYGELEKNVQLNGGRYVDLGSDDKIEFRQAVRFIRSVLPQSEAAALRRKEMWDAKTEADGDFSKRTLDRALDWLVALEDGIAEITLQERGSPKVYYIPEEEEFFISAKPPPQGGENKSEQELQDVLEDIGRF